MAIFTHGSVTSFFDIKKRSFWEKGHSDMGMDQYL
jgi:hypothetical protein